MIGTNKQVRIWLENQPDKTWEIKEYHEKRSNNANSYYWVLLTQLAGLLRISNEEAHFLMIKSYSQVYVVNLPEAVNPRHIFRYYEISKNGTIKGVPVIQYKVYQPSSEMNSKEFTRLLDGLISECKELGIETKTPDQLKELEGYEK